MLPVHGNAHRASGIENVEALLFRDALTRRQNPLCLVGIFGPGRNTPIIREDDHAFWMSSRHAGVESSSPSHIRLFFLHSLHPLHAWLCALALVRPALRLGRSGRADCGEPEKTLNGAKTRDLTKNHVPLTASSGF